MYMQNNKCVSTSGTLYCAHTTSVVRVQVLHAAELCIYIYVRSSVHNGVQEQSKLVCLALAMV